MSSITKSVKQDAFEIRSNIRFENLKNFRNGKIRLVFGIGMLIPALFIFVPLLSGSDYPENGISFISSLIGFAALIFLLFALFLGSDAINRGHSDKTALLVYPYPQKRTNLVIAKYITQLLTSWFAILVFYGIIAGATLVIYGADEIPTTFGTSIAFSFLYMSTLLAFAFFLSAVLDSTSASSTLTFFAVMILLPISNLLLGAAGIDTAFLFTNYSSYISSSLGIASASFGPGGGAVIYGFNDAVLLLASTSILFIFLTLYFSIKKEVN
ncbi:MAG: ABC transporter permease [Candidatus Heimdallarchaeota archaeon]|nr:ABC transporter permease [Candidatus Heimdallarchaeota archaeon]